MNKSILLTVILLQGCGAYECIDMNFKREAKPIEKIFNVSLEIQDEKMSKNIKCEEYYDAMCTERGNYWAMREEGYESQNEVSTFEFTDKNLGVVKVPVPSCSNMVNEINTPLNHITLEINGETFWPKSSNGDHRIYRTSVSTGEPEKNISLKLSLKVNNVPLQ